MDMPTVISAEALNSIDFNDISSKIENYSSVIDVVKKTWTKESLLDILSGKISIPDDVINASIAEQIDETSKVKSLTVSSQANGKLKINADTKAMGRLELTGTIDEFVHRGDTSYVKFTVKERELPDHQVMSWIFSRISLSMAQKIVGKIDLADDLKTDISHNTITVDYQDLLLKSEIGQVSFQGYNLLDALVIEKAEPKDGYIEFTTGLNLPEPVKAMLLNILL